ncbi:nodulation protein NfeD [candidate division KSB1 bacterium]|nr:nodulation protein NfeD [candidate division KSB1 bacterium]
MKKYIIIYLIVLLIQSSLSVAESSAAAPVVDLIKIESGTINPVSAEYIIDAIDNAEKNGSQCLIIQLDTPGGLLSSTQKIVQEMMASEIPIVVYVYPSGAGAVSAGVSITIAANFAVMAPGTSIGAAHPVTGSKTDSADIGIQKATQWWASFNRSIADKRGRNSQWVEDAVINSVSITETEAVQKNVIDFICPDYDSLLILLDGQEAKLDSGTVVLNTKEATITTHEMSIRGKILDIISNPSIAYILFTLGLLGIYFELSNPGAILPGVLGGIFLILAFFAMQQLPVNVAGILLIIFATILFILEVKITSYGILTIGGIVSMFLGSLMLFKNTPSIDASLPISLILGATITTALFFIFAIGMALKAQTKKVTTGKEGIVGEIGIASTKINPNGKVKVHGEYWNAHSDEVIKKGEHVVVEKIDRLLLYVKKS